MIRAEEARDYDAVREITYAAFEHHPFSHQTEHKLVEALREAGAITLALVAEQAGEVVGHIAFSPVQINGEFLNWYGLGPVSVRPDVQRQGTGKALIREGLARLRKMGAQGCVLLGDPEYYRRFGFGQEARLQLEGVPPEHFLVLAFGDSIPTGLVTYHRAFSDFG